MNWRTKTVCRILLMIAKIVAGEPELQTELQHLSNHITWGEKAA